MIASASAAVPADIARLAAAGLAWNARDSCGSSGCGVYSSANVASPAANSPSLTRRIPGSRVPQPLPPAPPSQSRHVADVKPSAFDSSNT